MRMRFAAAMAALLLCVSFAGAQTTTTVTGTIKDLTGAAVTSGYVTFTLQPAVDTTISGSARFTPQTVTCNIINTGAIKATDNSSACTVTNNTALVPSGTDYLVTICAYSACSSQFNWFATGGSQDLTQVVPTPSTAPTYTFVDTLTNQTIAGNKTFTGSVAFNGSLTTKNLAGERQADQFSSITAACADRPGGPVRIPAGTYSPASSITCTSITNLYGDGEEETVIQPPIGFTGCVVNLSLTGSYFRISDLTIDMTNAPTQDAICGGLGGFAWIEHLEIKFPPGATGRCWNLSGSFFGAAHILKTHCDGGGALQEMDSSAEVHIGPDVEIANAPGWGFDAERTVTTDVGGLYLQGLRVTNPNNVAGNKGIKIASTVANSAMPVQISGTFVADNAVAGPAFECDNVSQIAIDGGWFTGSSHPVEKINGCSEFKQVNSQNVQAVGNGVSAIGFYGTNNNIFLRGNKLTKGTGTAYHLFFDAASAGFGTINQSVLDTGGSVPSVNDSTKYEQFRYLKAGAFQSDEVGQNILITSPSADVELGSTSTPGSPVLDFHTSGTGNDHDERITGDSGVGGSPGLGNLTFIAAQGYFTGKILAVGDINTAGSVIAPTAQFGSASGGGGGPFTNNTVTVGSNSGGTVFVFTTASTTGFANTNGTFGAGACAGPVTLIGGGTVYYNLAGLTYPLLVSNSTTYRVQATGSEPTSCGANVPGNVSLSGSGVSGLKLPALTAGKAACINASKQVSACTTTVDASGNCTCP